MQMECCAWEHTGHRSPRRRVDPGSWRDIPQLSRVPRLSLSEVLHQAPRLLELVSPNDRKTLLAVCRSTRQFLHAFASYVRLQEDDTLQRLLSTAVGPYLQRLELQGIRLTVTDISGLTSAPWSGILTSLTLSNCRLHTSTIIQLAAGEWPMLQHLALRENNLGTAAVQAMASGKWPCLHRLDLSSNKMNANAITELTQLGWSRLTGLELHDNSALDRAAIQRLAFRPWKCLTGLSISGGFTLNFFVRMAAFAWPLLDSVYLDCDYCPSQAVSFAGVWRNMQNMQIKTRGPSEMASLAKPVMLELTEAGWPKLQSLDLSNSHIGADGFAQLALGEWPLLSTLVISHIQLTDDDFIPEDYAKFALGKWLQLTYLCLSHNDMDDECAAALTIADWPKLQTLDLSCNDIGASGSASLAQGKWPKMEHLCLRENKPECMCPCCFLQQGL